MATFRFELNNKPSRNNRYGIFLCISVGGKRKRVSTPISVEKQSHFNYKCRNDNWIRANVPESKAWNTMLHDILEEAKQKYIDLADENQASSQGVANKLKEKEQTISFLAFARDLAENILNGGGYRNWKKYNGAINKLEAFLKSRRRKDLLFTELTPELLTKMDSYLHQLRNARHPEQLLHPNTIEVFFNIIKTMVKKGIALGYMDASKNPFLNFEYKGIPTEKEKLTEEELAALLSLDLEEGSSLWNCRNYFFFSFFLGGIRAGDLIQLRWKNIYNIGEVVRLNYTMGKTNKAKDLKVVEQAITILRYYGYGSDSLDPNDFIFPLMDRKKPYGGATTPSEVDRLPIELKKQLLADVGSRNALINKYLRKLASMAGINKKLSMHIARHSFANLGMHDGVATKSMQSILGHFSSATTDRYMGNFKTSETDEILDQMFGSRFRESSSDDTDSTRRELSNLMEDMTEKELKELLAYIGRSKSK